MSFRGYLLLSMSAMLLLISTSFANAQEPVRIDKRKAIFYPLGQRGKTPLFTQDIEIKWRGEGDADFVSIAKDPAGVVVLKEEATLVGGQMRRHIVFQEQVGEKYEVEVVKNEATFRTFKKENNGGYNIVSDRKHKTDQVVFSGPAVEVYLRDFHEELMKKKSIAMSFAVFELERPLDFKITSFGLDKEKKTLKAQMKIDNVIFALFLDPIDLEFDLSEKKVLFYKGRTPLRISHKGSFQPLDAEIEYKTVL